MEREKRRREIWKLGREKERERQVLTRMNLMNLEYHPIRTWTNSPFNMRGIKYFYREWWVENLWVESDCEWALSNIWAERQKKRKFSWPSLSPSRIHFLPVNLSLSSEDHSPTKIGWKLGNPFHSGAKNSNGKWGNPFTLQQKSEDLKWKICFKEMVKNDVKNFLREFQQERERRERE